MTYIYIKHTAGAKAAPTDCSSPRSSVVIIRCLSPPGTGIIWLLTLLLCVCGRVRACAMCDGGYHIRTMEKQHENLHSLQGHLTLNTSCEGCLCLRLSPSLSLSPWVVIFTQPYGVTAQIINYSSPRERDSKRGSVTIPDRKGEQWVSGKLWGLVGCRFRKLRFCMMGSCSSCSMLMLASIM